MTDVSIPTAERITLRNVPPIEPQHELHEQPTDNLLFPPFKLLVSMDNKWLEKPNLSKVYQLGIIAYVLLTHDQTASKKQFAMEWEGIASKVACITETDMFSVFNISENTAEFVKKCGLHDSVAWLLSAASNFFPKADFEIDLIPEENEEESMLALRIYGSLSASEFRKLRHDLCKAMVEAGHRKLYEIIGIFQRRKREDEWQAISWYRSLSTG